MNLPKLAAPVLMLVQHLLNARSHSSDVSRKHKHSKRRSEERASRSYWSGLGD